MVTLIKRGGRLPLRRGTSVEVKPVELEPVQPESGRDIRTDAEGTTDGVEPDDPVSRAQREAEIILNTARSEAESVLEQARAEGIRQGLMDAANVVSDLISQIESLQAEIVAYRNVLIDDVEPQLLNLVMQIVEKVIRHEIRTDPRVVERAIKACLKRVKDSSEAWIRVNPDELEHVRAVRDELLSATDGIRCLHIVDDRRVDPGGCVVECGSGSFDARVATQLKRLRDKLMEAFENGRREADTGPDEVQRGDSED